MIGVFGLVLKECRTTILHRDIDLSRMKMHTQQIEVDKIREKGLDLSSMSIVSLGSMEGNTLSFKDVRLCQRLHQLVLPCLEAGKSKRVYPLSLARRKVLVTGHIILLVLSVVRIIPVSVSKI